MDTFATKITNTTREENWGTRPSPSKRRTLEFHRRHPVYKKNQRELESNSDSMIIIYIQGMFRIWNHAVDWLVSAMCMLHVTRD